MNAFHSDSTERIIRNLDIVASVGHNDKLMSEGDIFVIYNPSAFRSLMRRITGENREMNVHRINECVKNAQQFVTSTVTEQRVGDDTSLQVQFHCRNQLNLCKQMLESMTNAMEGLDKMQKTYADDAAIVSRLRMIQRSVTDFLSTMQDIQRTHNLPRIQE